jgi:hypothetical protein
MTFLRLIELDRGKNIHGPFREQKENPFYRFSAPPSFHTTKAQRRHRALQGSQHDKGQVGVSWGGRTAWKAQGSYRSHFEAAGIVRHIGTPLEIYDRPANIFVASFIGSPAMNLISAMQKHRFWQCDQSRRNGFYLACAPLARGGGRL